MSRCFSGGFQAVSGNTRCTNSCQLTTISKATEGRGVYSQILYQAVSLLELRDQKSRG